MVKAVVFSAFVLPRDAGDVLEPREQQSVEKACRELVENFQRARTVGLVYVFIADGYEAILNSADPVPGLAKESRTRRILQSAIDKKGPGSFKLSAPLS